MPERRSLLASAPALAAASTLNLPYLPAGATLLHATAASLRGLPVLTSTARPFLTLARTRRDRWPAWETHWADLTDDEIVVTPDGVRVTSLLRTLSDCGRTMPLYDAVALLDAALRFRLVTAGQLKRLAASSCGPGSGRLRRAVSLSSELADSPQESVARVALALLKMPAVPQFCLLDGPFEHPFDLALRWAKIVIDLQSKQAHAEWEATRKDIGIQGMVNLQRGWRLVWSVPDEVLPNPAPFAAKVMRAVVLQPGKECSRFRARHTHDDGDIRYPWQVNPDDRHFLGH